MATKEALNYEAIINEATEKLEARFSEIQNELAPLRQEEREVAEAIHRIVGSYPAGYSARATAARRSTPRAPGTPVEDREAAILEFVNSQPGGTTAKAIADAIGVSTNTLKATLDPMLDTGALRSEGEKRGRKILPPK